MLLPTSNTGFPPSYIWTRGFQASIPFKTLQSVIEPRTQPDDELPTGDSPHPATRLRQSLHGYATTSYDTSLEGCSSNTELQQVGGLWVRRSVHLSQAHMETLRDCTRLVICHPPVGKLSTHHPPTKPQPLVVMAHGDLGAMYPGLDKLCRHLRIISVSDTAPHCCYALAIHVRTNQDIRGD